MPSVSELDVFFLSYDEPNAERHWADLLDKAPWAKRVHGVKGFGAAHRACAEQSETEWFVTVDADNIVNPAFFNRPLLLNDPRRCLSFNGLNQINGLIYGNGGLKVWSREFVLDGGAGHETTEDSRHAVDFCWQDEYVNQHMCYSEVWVNGSAFQAFRVGFREGVKLTLDRGERIPAKDMRSRLHPMNLRNLRIWCSVGIDHPHGASAMMGARLGWAHAIDPNFDHVVVRDYDWFDENWRPIFEKNHWSPTTTEMEVYGHEIERATGVHVPILDEAASAFFRDTFKLRNE